MAILCDLAQSGVPHSTGVSIMRKGKSYENHISKSSKNVAEEVVRQTKAVCQYLLMEHEGKRYIHLVLGFKELQDPLNSSRTVEDKVVSV